jgi:tetratricopeptide (TPR) repeat protein
MYGDAMGKAPNDIDLKLRIATTQVAAGHPEKAEKALREILKERPSSAEANHFYGRALLAKGSNPGEALDYLQKAVQFDPNRAEFHLYVAIAANEVGQPGRAEAAVARTLELDAEMADAYWQRGVLKKNTGATLDAIADLLKAIDKRPSRYEAYAALALCYYDQNDLVSAENAWRRAIQGNPSVAEWHYQLGRMLHKKGDWKGTIAEMSKAIELAASKNPRPAWLHTAHFDIADAYKKSNDKEKALAHFKAYLEIAPSNDAYRSEATEAVASLGGAGGDD